MGKSLRLILQNEEKAKISLWNPEKRETTIEIGNIIKKVYGKKDVQGKVALYEIWVNGKIIDTIFDKNYKNGVMINPKEGIDFGERYNSRDICVENVNGPGWIY